MELFIFLYRHIEYPKRTGFYLGHFLLECNLNNVQEQACLIRMNRVTAKFSFKKGGYGI